MRNPFRRRSIQPDQPEYRTLGPDSVHFPLDQGIVDPVVPGPTGHALRLAPVFGAGRIIAANIASLPLCVYRKTADGAVTKLPTPPLFQKPSVIGTRHDWIFRAVSAMVYRGNAVGLITEVDQLEYPLRVEWLNPDWIWVTDTVPELGERGSFTNPIWFYRGVEIPRTSLVHIPWFTWPYRVLGLSPMAAYGVSVSTGLAAQRYTADWFLKGGVPPGTYKNSEQTISQEDADTIKRKLVQSIARHEPIVHGNDWTYTPIAITPNEAQFVQTMQLTASDVATVYGIWPAEMIGGATGKSMTYQNVEQQSIQFVQFTLLPWISKLEDALSALLPRGQYVKFDTDEIVRPDANTRFANYERSRLIGLHNIDELRAKENEPPLPDGQGKDYTPLPIQAGTQVAIGGVSVAAAERE